MTGGPRITDMVNVPSVPAAATGSGSDANVRIEHEMIILRDDDRQQILLDAIDDPDSRRILARTGADALSASEIAERCGLPLSTTYRKLNALSDAGLLFERTRIRQSGKHLSEYRRRVDDVKISVAGEDGVVLELAVRSVVGG